MASDAIVGSGSGSAGIQFEDVEGVGDEARFALTVGAGDLHVRAGNLYFVASAYAGPGMQMPEKLTGASIIAADKQWRRDTVPQRKDAATKLAKAVVQSLCAASGCSCCWPWHGPPMQPRRPGTPATGPSSA